MNNDLQQKLMRDRKTNAVHLPLKASQKGGRSSRHVRGLSITTVLMAAGLLMACTATSRAQVFPASAGHTMIETFAKGLDHPWTLAFLPDGRMLVTERPGRL